MSVTDFCLRSKAWYYSGIHLITVPGWEKFIVPWLYFNVCNNKYIWATSKYKKKVLPAEVSTQNRSYPTVSKDIVLELLLGLPERVASLRRFNCVNRCNINLSPCPHLHVVINSGISNHMTHKIWNEITYQFPNFNGATVEVWEWISCFTLHCVMGVITYPCWS